MIKITFVISILLIILLLLQYREYIVYYLLIPLVPFSQSIPIISLGNRSINLGMDTVLIIIIISWHFLFKSNRDYAPFIYKKTSAILLLWLLWNFITVLISATYLSTQEIGENLVVLLRWGQYVPIFIILANGKLNYEQSKKTVPILIVSGVIAAGLGFFQINQGLDPLYFKGAPSFTVPLFREADLSEQLDEFGFYMGSANYNVVGAYLLVVLSIAFPFIIALKHPLKKTFGYLLIAILIAGIVITFSRISLIACVVCLLLTMYMYSRRIFIKGSFIILFFILSSFIFFYDHRLVQDFVDLWKVSDVIPQVLAGEQWSPNQEVSSQVFGAASRLVGLRDSIIIFLNHPIFGYGFNAYKFFGFRNTPDNYFLQTLAETGIIGFCLMVWFFRSLLSSTQNLKMNTVSSFTTAYRIGFISVIIVMLIVNFTSGIFYIQKVWGAFIIVAGIWISLIHFPSIHTQKSER